MINIQELIDYLRQWKVDREDKGYLTTVGLLIEELEKNE